MQGGEQEGHVPPEEEQRTESLEPKPEQGKVEETQGPSEKLPGVSVRFKVTTDRGDVEFKAKDVSVVSGKKILEQNPDLVTHSTQVEFQGLERKPEEEAVAPSPTVSPLAEQKPTPEGRERASELRRRYQEMNVPRFLELPLDEIPNLPQELVEKAKGEGMTTVDLFIKKSLYSLPNLSPWKGSDSFLESYGELIKNIGTFLVQKEQEALDQLGLTEVEKDLIDKMSSRTSLNTITESIEDNYHYRRATVGWLEGWQLSHLHRNLKKNLPSPEELGTLSMRTKRELIFVGDGIEEKKAAQIERYLASVGLASAKE